eukprot:11554672-Alexandrium_andersonii.AAC.1
MPARCVHRQAHPCDLLRGGLLRALLALPARPRCAPRPPGEGRPRRVPHQGCGGVPQGAVLRAREAD